MAKTKWDRDKIVKRILTLQRLDEDLTCSHVKEIDSALVGAAISYFKNWGAALEASGLDYDEIRKLSKQRRNEKVKKWSTEKVLEDIRRVAETEDDISHAFMKEKHPTLVAAATNYIGSWKKAIELAGLDYDEIIIKGRRLRAERKNEWYRMLLVERLAKMNIADEKVLQERNPEFHKRIIKYFGDWRTALREVKKKYRESSPETTRQ